MKWDGTGSQPEAAASPFSTQKSARAVHFGWEASGTSGTQEERRVGRDEGTVHEWPLQQVPPDLAGTSTRTLQRRHAKLLL